jgi:hypothetical protein
MQSERNRPEDFMPNALAQPAPTARTEMIRKVVGGLVKGGMQPEEIAAVVVDAIRNDTFYILPVQPDIARAVQTRLEDIRLRRNPTLSQLF